MKTNIILGAGFSMIAKYPSSQELSSRLLSTENKLLKQSSGEWQFDGDNPAASNNGRLNTDYLNISYLLPEFIEAFQKETYQVFDYEEFYSWFLIKYNDIPFLKVCCNKANERLIQDLSIPYLSRHIFKNPDINQYRISHDAFHYLVADILGKPYSRREQISSFDPFIDIINSSSSTNIFTLNHDTLLEFLLDHNNIKFSDGFSTTHSLIVNFQNEKLEVFSNFYSEKVKIYKLHGSITYNLFTELIPNQGGVYHDTGKYWFFKVNTNWDKYNARLIDPVTGDIVQAVNSNLLPQFLTGKSKTSIIGQHLIYKDMSDHFTNSLSDIDQLIIIGYSFRDHHINQIIKNAIDKFQFHIVNVNPGASFPFKRNYSHVGIDDLEALHEISKLTTKPKI